MPSAIQKVGTIYGRHVRPIDWVQALAFAAATSDDNPAYAAGTCVPPVFAVVPTWEPLSEALADLVPADAMAMVVHGEQDMHLVQPLRPGRTLATRAHAFSLRPGRSGTRATVRLVSEDAEGGGVVLDQYVTMFVRGMAGGRAEGPETPDHAFPGAARAHPIGEHSVPVDADQTRRYADASGDHNPIHLDDAVARSVGLPGVIVHGLCTLAMACRSVVALADGGDPTRLRRLAVRFSAVVTPGSELVTTAYDAGNDGVRRVVAFESRAGGRTVLTHGRAEIE